MLKFIFKLFRGILMLTGVISFNRCGSGYHKDGDKVLFNGKEVSKNLQVLNKVFAKDDTTAYFKTYSIDGADIATFTALDEHYAKDKNTVYYCDEYRESQNYYLTKRSTITKITQARPTSFAILTDGYAKDDLRAYFEGVGFAVKDLLTLAVINTRFIKDQWQVYFEQKPVKGSDVQSFRLLNSNYAQDAAHAYYYGYPSEVYNGIHVIPCNSGSFTLLNYPYAKDDASVFYVYSKMAGADAKTFSVLKNGFSKDQKSVFFESKKINGADATTFMVMPEAEESTGDFYYAKDKTTVFWEDKKLPVADLSSFKVLGHGYAIDYKQVYYKTKIVQQADPKSFKIYPHGFGDADAEDKNNKYDEGIKVPQ